MAGNEEMVSMAMNELNAIAEQKQEVLIEFGKKYSKLEAEVKELEAKKKALADSIRPVEDIKEEALVIIKKAKSQESEIIKGAEAEARLLLDKARDSAKGIINEALEIKAEYEATRAGINSMVDGAAEKERKAKEYLLSAEKILLDAEIKGSESQKAHEQAINDQAKAAELIALADIKRTALSVYEDKVTALDRDVSKSRAELDEKRVLISDMQKALDLSIALFEEEKKRIYVEIDSDKALWASRLKVVKEQEESNAWRSRELDIGFELLKNKQASLDRDIKRLEGLKKELSK